MQCPRCPDKKFNFTEKELYIHNKYFHKEDMSMNQHMATVSMPNGICPDCGATLWQEEGCAKCQSCGYTRC